jgi:hypothetical protein
MWLCCIVSALVLLICSMIDRSRLHLFLHRLQQDVSVSTKKHLSEARPEPTFSLLPESVGSAPVIFPSSTMTATDARQALSTLDVVANELSPIIVAELDRLGLRSPVSA